MNDPKPAPSTGPHGRPLPAPQPYHPTAEGYTDVDLPRYEPAGDELNLRSLWRIARKRRWMILGIALVVTTLVTIDAYRAKPRFEAAATIEIGAQSGALVTGGEIYYQEYDPLYVTMNTSEVILTSPPLLEDVVVQLGLDRKSAFVEANQRRSVMESLNEIAGKFQPEERLPAPRVFTSTEVDIPAETELRSPEEVERLKPLVGIVSNGLRVRPIQDTRVMTVTFTHGDPRIAADVANAVAGRFVEMSNAKRTESFDRASEYFRDAKASLETERRKAEEELAAYMREHDIYSLEGRDTLVIDNLSDLQEQATRAKLDRIIAESLYQEVLEGRIREIPDAFVDPQILELERRLDDLSIRSAQLGATYGPENPLVVEVDRQMTEIRAQIDDSRDQLADKLKADYEIAVREEAALAEALDGAKTAAARENQDAVEYSLLAQNVETAKTLYNQFDQKTLQSDLEDVQQQNNIRIIAEARVPGSPVGPNRRQTVLMGLALSLVGGMGLAWGMERFNNSIRSVDDVLHMTQLPSLAVIPAMKPSHSLLSAEVRAARSGQKLPAEMQRARLMQFDGRSPTAEAYRALRTGLLLSAAGHPPKTILVTSVRAGEGKTTTATNTAIALAQLGGLVLLIDADMRKPSVHEVFDVSQSTGLSSYLAGKRHTSEVTQHPVKNLSVMPAGPPPPNPAELLSSEEMTHLLGMASDEYAHVVIDSPPMGSVTDAVILSTMVDGVILVVHGGKNSRQAVQRACHELTAVGAKIFGIVLNNVDLKKEGYDDYYYYSSSYYAYTQDEGGKQTVAG